MSKLPHQGPPFESAYEEQAWFNWTYANCMSQWAALEDGMGMAFFPLFGESYFVSRSIFYATQGMGAKASLIDAGYTAFCFGSVIYEKWSKISKKLESSIRDRNKLTHGQVFGTLMENKGKNFCIETPILSISGKIKGKKYRFFGEDIEKIRLRAAQVREDLSALGVIIGSITRPNFSFGSHYKLDQALERLDLVGIELPKLAESGILETVFGER